MTERFTIKNRHGLNIVIQVDAPENPKRLVFIAHGQGGFIEQPHIESFSEAFLQNDYRVVRFDATHALGQSDGDLIDVTYDSYVEDLEDVIDWARSQTWFMQPFALCGHSMGAQSTAWYAEHHSDEVSLIAPMAPVVNYDLYISTMTDEFRREYKTRGYKQMQSRSKPGVIKRVGWDVVESLKKYDLLPNASNLNMPVFIAVGDHDEPCPFRHQKIFIDAIGSQQTKLELILDSEHSYRNSKTQLWGDELVHVRTLLANWVYSVKS